MNDRNGDIGPYAFKGNQWVGFDDVNAIRRKVIIDKIYLRLRNHFSA